MNKVLAVAVAALMIMAGMLIYHEINSPQLPRYNLNIGLNNTEIQNVTINNYAYHNIHSDWFNVTMTAYGNYTILFPYYVAYGGHINDTAQVYLARNTTVLFNIPNITVHITTQDPNASLTFQQMIHLNRTKFTFINSAFQNIAFFYNNGTPIYAWLESINSYGNATIWLKLNGSINRTVNVKVYGPTANEMNSKDHYGEAPQLSATYGQYDNGAKVFSFYENFAGAILPSGWSASDSSGISVNNGVQINNGAVYTKSAVFPSLNNVEEIYVKYTALNELQDSGLIQSNTQTPQGANGGSNAEILWITNYGSNGLYAYSDNGTSPSYNLQNGVYSGFIPSLNQFYVLGTFVSNSIVGEQINYQNILTAQGTYSTNQYIILGYFPGGDGGSTAINPIFVQWVRVRAYPPGGVMPSSSSLSNFGPIYIGG